MTLLNLIKSRHELAQKFTKKYQDQVKQNLKDYKAEDSWLNSFADNNKLFVNVTKRYEVIIPMIFTTHESMLSSMFDRVPDLIIDQGGADDEQKAIKIKATYEYLKQKLDLETFMTTSAWWYLLTGFVSAHVGYVQKTKEVPATDEEGQEMMDEEGNPIMVTAYEDDDPEVYVDDPMFTNWSPESEYSIDASGVPYYTREKLMTVEDVFRTYEAIVEPDSSLKDFKKKNDGDTTDVIEEDLERVKIIMYYGKLTGKYEEELQENELEYDPDAWYYIVSTRSQMLHIERTPEDMKTCSILKWHGVPSEFFGFGIAHLLRPFQKEKSLRRTQQSRYADIAAFPKLLVKNDGESDIDEIAYSDPRELPVLTYEGERPDYLVPPDLSNVLVIGEQKADEDAQKASGMMDLAQGAQSTNTVNTATGQAIFAEASEKRIRMAKANFMRFYRDVVVKLLKLCQIYWSEEKIVSITDGNGQNVEVHLTSSDLKEIDFDTDIKIDIDSITVNKDVIRAQAIELYNMIKDDPLVERKEVFKDLIEDGFSKRNSEKYLKEMGVEPGTQLVNPQTGEQYTIDETGELVTQQAEQETAEPTGSPDVPTDQAGVMAGAQQL